MPDSWAASTSPPVAATPLRRLRRLTLVIVILLCVRSSVMSRSFRSRANGRVNTLIAAAAAQIAGHAVEDLLVCRRRRLGQQRRGLHDLPGLAVSALRHADFARRHLHGVLVLGVQAFDRGDRLAD